MASNGLCFVCRYPMAPNDCDIRSVQFVGDSADESGRYAAHAVCAAPLRREWVTRQADGLLVPLSLSGIAPSRKSWIRKILYAFFAWGASRFQPQREYR